MLARIIESVYGTSKVPEKNDLSEKNDNGDVLTQLSQVSKEDVDIFEFHVLGEEISEESQPSVDNQTKEKVEKLPKPLSVPNLFEQYDSGIQSLTNSMSGSLRDSQTSKGSVIETGSNSLSQSQDQNLPSKEQEIYKWSEELFDSIKKKPTRVNSKQKPTKILSAPTLHEEYAGLQSQSGPMTQSFNESQKQDDKDGIESEKDLLRDQQAINGEPVFYRWNEPYEAEPSETEQSDRSDMMMTFLKMDPALPPMHRIHSCFKPVETGKLKKSFNEVYQIEKIRGRYLYIKSDLPEKLNMYSGSYILVDEMLYYITGQHSYEKVSVNLNEFYKKIASFNIKIGANKIFLKNEQLDELMKLTGNQANLKKSLKNKNCFFKQSKRQHDFDQFMCVGEAYIWGVYNFVAPEYVSSSTKAHFDPIQNKYVGCSSEAISGFQSTREFPLKKEDLDYRYLNHFSIEEMEKLDKSLGDSIDEKNNKQIVYTKEEGAASFSIVAQDVKNYRIAKGLAVGLVLRYVGASDDTHARNFSIKGFQIDFDMDFWKFLFKYKPGTVYDVAFRNPLNRFEFTAKDMRDFPVLQDATPFYWVTIFQQTLEWLASVGVDVPDNRFTQEEVALYKQLKDHPIFIYHKYSTFLKFSLMTEDICLQIAKLHIPGDFVDEGRPLINLFAKHVWERVTKMKEVLFSMPEFQEFIQINGKAVFEKIVNQMEEYNKKMQKKAEKNPLYAECQIKIKEVSDIYCSISLESVQTNRKGLTYP